MPELKTESPCPECQKIVDLRVKEEMDKISHPYQWFGGRSYAQHGDDFIILNIFYRIGIELPSYIDVGAHHPYLISNTALLYERGCRGANVEANPVLIDAFLEHRPEDININIGVGPEKGEMTFYYDTETSGRNSFIKEKVDDLGIIDQKKLPVTTLWSIIEEHLNGQFPDILSIDVEGLDLQILKTIPFEKSKPKVICVEIVDVAPGEKNPTKDFLVSKGYFPYVWAGSNLFFIEEKYRAKFY